MGWFVGITRIKKKTVRVIDHRECACVRVSSVILCVNTCGHARKGTGIQSCCQLNKNQRLVLSHDYGDYAELALAGGSSIVVEDGTA